jgi:transposase
MGKAFSLAFKQKMVERLTGKNALNQSQLARETGVRQQNLCRWLEEARSLPIMVANNPRARVWSVEQKAQALADASNLTGAQLSSYLKRGGIKLADFERWRVALEEDDQGSVATTKRIRKLERELARKEKALAEAAVLLVLKKTIDSYYNQKDDDTEEPSEKSS